MITKSGIPAMVDHARKAASRADVQSANYFLKGWSELPPLPTPGTALALAGPNVIPIAKPRGQQETDDLFDRAMERARSRTQESS
jgi:hypothetical protein